MSVLQICDHNPPTVAPDDSVADAIRRMLRAHAGAVTVVDSGRVVAGIFTERDVLKRLILRRRDLEFTPVRDVMTTPVEMATEKTTEAEALAVMLEHHYRHMPVVDNGGRLLGMLSLRHVLEARIDDLLQQLNGNRR
jgi:CBS domain-containing protein